MSDAAKKKKKRKSQAPVALVYFATMLLFLVVFGLIASFLVERITSFDEPEPVETVTYASSYTTIYARLSNKGTLMDIALVRIAPEKEQIIVTPVSPFTVSEKDGATFREVLKDGGIKNLQKAVDSTFGITTDYYISVSNSTFENIADILGGIVYTPPEELYYLNKDSDGNDIAYPAGETVSIAGHQIRLICQYPVFSEGMGGNMKFLGEALFQLVNNAFQQSNITKNTLDNMFSTLTSNSDTNYNSNDFKQHKTYLVKMLSEPSAPAVKLVPEGTWTDGEHFTVSADFKSQLAKAYRETEPGDGSGADESSSQP
ncbi:MAG: LCP family protein [Oscillospiraceae bacterium]